jgi:hypothetical protein
MVGNAEVAQAIDREFPDKIFRYINSEDPVPKLPTVSLIANAFRHCEKEMLLGVTAVGAAAASVADFFKQMAAKTQDGILHRTLIDDIWSGLKERGGAHAMSNYRSLIAELSGKS